MKRFWRKIWGLQIPNKVKHFAWRACKNIRPSLSNLKRRGIVVDDSCEECHGEGESPGHLLWRCPFAADIWSHTSIFDALN